MVSIVRLPSAVETAIASGSNCTDSSYDSNPLIIATSTATSATSATAAAAAIIHQALEFHQIHQSTHIFSSMFILFFLFFCFILLYSSSIPVLYFHFSFGEFIPWRIHTKFTFGEFIPWRIHTCFSTLKTAIFINYSSYRFSFREKSILF